jgi:hypothetical protein
MLRKDKLDEILADFKRQQEKVESEGKKKIVETEAQLDAVRTRIKDAQVGSPQYFNWHRMQESFHREIITQLNLMMNASAHYMLALYTAIAFDEIFERKSPILVDEVERMKKQLDEHLTKRLSQIFGKKDLEYVA